MPAGKRKPELGPAARSPKKTRKQALRGRAPQPNRPPNRQENLRV